ncbi:MAG TPA: redoxin domain-containing protein [Victivallales bacterium]|nr:redoxin domain-containing protein [Victivallales bacterium]
MKTFTKVIISISILLCALSAFSLKLGSKATELQVSEWLKNGPVSLKPDTAGDKIYVIFFFATWSNSTANVFRFVSEQKAAFGDYGVEFIGISPENAQIVKKFIKDTPDLNITFALGIDDHSKTYEEYMKGQEGVPVFFIYGKDKKLIWEGGPAEENGVLLHVLGGTFDAETQKKVENYHKEMRRATQEFNFNERLEYAEKILKIDPMDRFAVDTMIDNYIRNNEVKKCLKFVEETRKKVASNKFVQFFLYISELNIARGIVTKEGKEYIKNLSEHYMESFGSNPDALDSYAIKLMVNIPPEITSLKYAMIMSKKAVDLQSKLNDDKKLALFLQTLARGYYLVGDIDKAIDAQNKVVGLFKSKDDKAKAILTKEYYETAKNLSRQY